MSGWADYQKNFFSKGIYALCKGWRTCIERGGDYVEKLYSFVPFLHNKYYFKNIKIFHLTQPRIKKKVIFQNRLLERTYRMSKREVTIDNIKSLILSINIVEKRVKQ